VYFLFFSRSNFAISDIILRPLIHFELIWVQVERLGSSFSLLQVDNSVFPAPFIEEAVFSPMHILGSFVKNQVTVAELVCVRVIYSISMAISCLILCQYHAVLLLCLCSIVWSQMLWYFQDWIGFYMNFRIDFSIFSEECHWNFDRDCIEHIDFS
jgi:hypothetical protein